MIDVRVDTRVGIAGPIQEGGHLGWHGRPRVVSRIIRRNLRGAGTVNVRERRKNRSRTGQIAPSSVPPFDSSIVEGRAIQRTYQANSALRRYIRGFMYDVGEFHPGVFGTNVGLNASVTLLFSRL